MILGCLRSWVSSAWLVSMGILWGYPQFPYYQEGLPYLYDLGGTAQVAVYIALGLFSVSMGTVIVPLSLGLGKGNQVTSSRMLGMCCALVGLSLVILSVILMNASFIPVEGQPW